MMLTRLITTLTKLNDNLQARKVLATGHRNKARYGDMFIAVTGHECLSSSHRPNQPDEEQIKWVIIQRGQPIPICVISYSTGLCSSDGSGLLFMATVRTKWPRGAISLKRNTNA